MCRRSLNGRRFCFCHIAEDPLVTETEAQTCRKQVASLVGHRKFGGHFLQQNNPCPSPTSGHRRRCFAPEWSGSLAACCVGVGAVTVQAALRVACGCEHLLRRAGVTGRTGGTHSGFFPVSILTFFPSCSFCSARAQRFKATSAYKHRMSIELTQHRSILQMAPLLHRLPSKCVTVSIVHDS